MLDIQDLHAEVGGVEILQGLTLRVAKGETHAIMGPNGSGKSTLANVLAGNPAYTVTAGKVTFEGEDLLAMAPEVRARKGVFLSFQHPVEIPGVRTDHFLRAGYNALQKSRGEEELDPLKFDRLIRNKVKVVDMDPALTKRSINDGFSGGEKKRNEMLQMAILEPKLRILDEVDSGLDVDALRSVSNSINELTTPETATILVTHYDRLLAYVIPDHVHVLMNGAIVASGGKELAKKIESQGYDWLANGVGE
jgi:Fe-S cluster assembly ATP-binding protein